MSACGPTDDDAAATSSLGSQPASEQSSLQEYLLTAEDFPDSQWQHIDQKQLQVQLAQQEQQRPSDQICAERLDKVEIRGGEVDAIIAVPNGQQTRFTMQIAAKPAIDLTLAEEAMTGGCATQTVTTEQGQARIEYTKVRTGVPGALVYRQAGYLASTDSQVSDTLIAYVNHDGVGINLTSLSTASTLDGDAPSVDVTEFTRILTRVIEVAEAA